MKLEKNYGSTVLRLYLPSIFIIIVGWLNFWIDRKEVSARVKLGTLVLLAMITEEVGITFIMPSRVTVSAVDVWFAVLLTYTTLVMVEFTIVHSIDRYQKKLKLLEEARQTDLAQKNHHENTDSIETISSHPDDGCNPRRRYKLEMDEQPLTKNMNCCKRFIATVSTGKIEKYSKILYAVSFALFQIFYWSYYLTKTETVD
ncbi:hypothetical protein KUTeg_023795 [Tegillarca granosa]|uniref:Neurotransmitter-gated ion-channel transmembrane domain-containing protein n=1 Tax=Tegillarca granosa TaxID=220873 RepID=A0ABQ9E3L8_TEGGR|nr:hypothetical protein KUTeg_023795 [Tegillarca granosa]